MLSPKTKTFVISIGFLIYYKGKCQRFIASVSYTVFTAKKYLLVGLPSIEIEIQYVYKMIKKIAQRVRALFSVITID
jgi:hypothetical protein